MTAANETCLRPRMLYEALADSVRERIFAHELAPGEPIDELKLASAYGVSRTPLREALKVLASEGLVELRMRSGCFVARLDRRDLEQLLDLLDLIESFAVREAARTRGTLSVGEDFFQNLLDAAGNRFLENLAGGLRAKLCLALGPAFSEPCMWRRRSCRPCSRRPSARAVRRRCCA